jgi:hypothetical protein
VDYEPLISLQFGAQHDYALIIGSNWLKINAVGQKMLKTA